MKGLRIVETDLGQIVSIEYNGRTFGAGQLPILQIHMIGDLIARFGELLGRVAHLEHLASGASGGARGPDGPGPR